MATLKNISTAAILKDIESSFSSFVANEEIENIAQKLTTNVPHSLLKTEFSDLVDYQMMLKDGLTETQYLNHFRLSHVLGTTRGYFYFSKQTLPLLSQLNYSTFKEVFLIDLKNTVTDAAMLDEALLDKVYESFDNVEVFVTYLSSSLFYKYIPKHLKSLLHFYDLCQGYNRDVDPKSLLYIMGLKQGTDLEKISDEDLLSISETVVTDLKTIKYEKMIRGPYHHLYKLLLLYPALEELYMSHFIGPLKSSVNLRKLSIISELTWIDDISTVSTIFPQLKFVEFECLEVSNFEALDSLLKIENLTGIRFFDISNENLVKFCKVKGESLKGLSLIYGEDSKTKMPYKTFIEVLTLCPNLILFQMYSREILLHFPREDEETVPEDSLLPRLKYLSLVGIHEISIPSFKFLLKSSELGIVEIRIFSISSFERNVYEDLMSASCWSSIHTLCSWNFITEEDKKNIRAKCTNLKLFLERDLNDTYTELSEVEFDNIVPSLDWWKCNHYQSKVPHKYNNVKIN